MRKRIDILEYAEKQSDIIRRQSRIIDDLFLALIQHMTADDLDEKLIEEIKTDAADVNAMEGGAAGEH